MIWRRLITYMVLAMTYEVHTRVVTLFVLLFAVLQGKLIRPAYIFPVLPLIRLFLEAFLLRTVMMQAFRMSELLVTASRLEVYTFVTS